MLRQNHKSEIGAMSETLKNHRQTNRDNRHRTKLGSGQEAGNTRADDETLGTNKLETSDYEKRKRTGLWTQSDC